MAAKSFTTVHIYCTSILFLLNLTSTFSATSTDPTAQLWTSTASSAFSESTALTSSERLTSHTAKSDLSKKVTIHFLLPSESMEARSKWLVVTNTTVTPTTLFSVAIATEETKASSLTTNTSLTLDTYTTNPMSLSSSFVSNTCNTTKDKTQWKAVNTSSALTYTPPLQSSSSSLPSSSTSVSFQGDVTLESKTTDTTKKATSFVERSSFGSTIGLSLTTFDAGLSTKGSLISSTSIPHIATSVTLSPSVTETPSVSSLYNLNTSPSVGSYSKKVREAIVTTLSSSAGRVLDTSENVTTAKTATPRSSTSAVCRADPTSSGVQFSEVTTIKSLASDTTTSSDLFLTVISKPSTFASHTPDIITSRIAPSKKTTPKSFISASQATDAIATVAPTSGDGKTSGASTNLTIHINTSAVLSTEETSKLATSSSLELDFTTSSIPSKSVTSKPSTCTSEASHVSSSAVLFEAGKSESSTSASPTPNSTTSYISSMEVASNLAYTATQTSIGTIVSSKRIKPELSNSVASYVTRSVATSSAKSSASAKQTTQSSKLSIVRIPEVTSKSTSNVTYKALTLKASTSTGQTSDVSPSASHAPFTKSIITPVTAVITKPTTSGTKSSDAATVVTPPTAIRSKSLASVNPQFGAVKTVVPFMVQTAYDTTAVGLSMAETSKSSASSSQVSDTTTGVVSPSIAGTSNSSTVVPFMGVIPKLSVSASQASDASKKAALSKVGILESLISAIYPPDITSSVALFMTPTLKSPISARHLSDATTGDFSFRKASPKSLYLASQESDATSSSFMSIAVAPISSSSASQASVASISVSGSIERRSESSNPANYTLKTTTSILPSIAAILRSKSISFVGQTSNAANSVIPSMAGTLKSSRSVSHAIDRSTGFPISTAVTTKSETSASQTIATTSNFAHSISVRLKSPFSSQALSVAISVETSMEPTANSSGSTIQASDATDVSVFSSMAVTLISRASQSQVADVTTSVVSSVAVTVEMLHSAGRKSNATTTLYASLALTPISSLRSASQTTHATIGFDSSMTVTSKLSRSASQATDTTTSFVPFVAASKGSVPTTASVFSSIAVTPKFSTSANQATKATTSVDPSISEATRSLRSARSASDAASSVLPFVALASTTTSSATQAIDVIRSVVYPLTLAPESSSPDSHLSGPSTSVDQSLVVSPQSTTFITYTPEATRSVPHSASITKQLSIDQASDASTSVVQSTKTASTSLMVESKTPNTAINIVSTVEVTYGSLTSVSQTPEETSKTVPPVAITPTLMTFRRKKPDINENAFACTAITPTQSTSESKFLGATWSVIRSPAVTKMPSVSLRHPPDATTNVVLTSRREVGDSTQMTVVTLEPSKSFTPVLPAATSELEEKQPSRTIVSVTAGAASPAPCFRGSECFGKAPHKRYRVTARIHGKYKSSYKNLGSSESLAFIKNFTERVGRLLKAKLPGYRRIEVTRLSNGSVVVDFIITMVRISNASLNIELALMEGNSTGELGVVLVGNIRIKEIAEASTTSPTTSAKDKGLEKWMIVASVNGSIVLLIFLIIVIRSLNSECVKKEAGGSTTTNDNQKSDSTVTKPSSQILTQKRWHKFPCERDNCDIEMTDITVKL